MTPPPSPRPVITPVRRRLERPLVESGIEWDIYVEEVERAREWMRDEAQADLEDCNE